MQQINTDYHNIIYLSQSSLCSSVKTITTHFPQLSAEFRPQEAVNDKVTGGIDAQHQNGDSKQNESMAFQR